MEKERGCRDGERVTQSREAGERGNGEKERTRGACGCKVVQRGEKGRTWGEVSGGAACRGDGEVLCKMKMGAGAEVRASVVSLRRDMMEGAKGRGAAAVDDGVAAWMGFEDGKMMVVVVVRMTGLGWRGR